MTDAHHRLGATCRCLKDDLGRPAGDCELSIEKVDHEVVKEFLKKRTGEPTGQEVVQTLAPELIAYSLHVGRWRGATWHQERLGVVWLLAAAIHRDDDKRADAYARFRKLFDVGGLMPTEDDVRRLFQQRSLSFAQTLVDVVPGMRERCVATPGELLSVELGGRVPIRLYCEAGQPKMLYVAVSQRLEPGSMSLPPDWLVKVLAAMFPDARLEELSWVGELAPDLPLLPNEVAFGHPL